MEEKDIDEHYRFLIFRTCFDIIENNMIENSEKALIII